MKFHDRLKKMNACTEAVEWVGDRSLARAWAECERADWMVWLAARGVNQGSPLHIAIVRAAVACVRPALKDVPKGEKRLAEALRVALRWCDDKATLDEVRVATDAAWAASYEASGSAYLAAASVANAVNAVSDAVYAADIVVSDYINKRSLHIIRRHIEVRYDRLKAVR
jgi:hypothetical protein